MAVMGIIKGGNVSESLELLYNATDTRAGGTVNESLTLSKSKKAQLILWTINGLEIVKDLNTDIEYRNDTSSGAQTTGNNFITNITNTGNGTISFTTSGFSTSKTQRFMIYG